MFKINIIYGTRWQKTKRESESSNKVELPAAKTAKPFSQPLRTALAGRPPTSLYNFMKSP